MKQDIFLKNVVVNNSETCLLLSDGKIAAIGQQLTAPEGAEFFDGKGRLAALPAFYNMHNHAAMTLLRSYAEDMELFDWLSNHIWPLEAKLTERDIYVGARLATLEMIRSGTVYFNDMYWKPATACRAAMESGMRATIGLMYICGADGKIVPENLESAQKLLECAKEDKENLITISHAPHAVYTVSGEVLREIGEKAREDGRFIQIHVAETAKEVSDCVAAHGKTPVEYLDELGVISPRTMMAHCVHLTDNDRAIIARRGALIAHNPASNLKLCSGMFDFEAAKKAGCRVAIGTDGNASNNGLSMLDEMKLAALTAKVKSASPLAGNKFDVFRAATAAGAEFVGTGAGGIAVGKAADLQLVDLGHLLLSANFDLIADMVYSADPEVIDSVICNGKFLMKHHVIPGADEIVAEAREVCAKLKSYNL